MDEEDAIWDDRFAESEEAVIGVCWYCEAKLRDGYDRAAAVPGMPWRGGELIRRETTVASKR